MPVRVLRHCLQSRCAEVPPDRLLAGCRRRVAQTQDVDFFKVDDGLTGPLVLCPRIEIDWREGRSLGPCGPPSGDTNEEGQAGLRKQDDRPATSPLAFAGSFDRHEVEHRGGSAIDRSAQAVLAEDPAFKQRRCGVQSQRILDLAFLVSHPERPGNLA